MAAVLWMVGQQKLKYGASLYTIQSSPNSNSSISCAYCVLFYLKLTQADYLMIHLIKQPYMIVCDGQNNCFHFMIADQDKLDMWSFTNTTKRMVTWFLKYILYYKWPFFLHSIYIARQISAYMHIWSKLYIVSSCKKSNKQFQSASFTTINILNRFFIELNIDLHW